MPPHFLFDFIKIYDIIIIEMKGMSKMPFDNDKLIYKPIMFNASHSTITELTAEHAVLTSAVRAAPAETEKYIRARIALQLADKIINEDLIQIQSDEDEATGVTNFRAKIKVVQE